MGQEYTMEGRGANNLWLGSRRGKSVRVAPTPTAMWLQTRLGFSLQWFNLGGAFVGGLVGGGGTQRNDEGK